MASLFQAFRLSITFRWRPIAPRASDAITFLASAHAGWFVNIAG